MSLFKNPIILSFLASSVVFVMTFYYYNYYCENVNDKKYSKKNKNDKKYSKSRKEKKSYVINETMILSSVIIGLSTWYIVTSYLSPEIPSINNTNINSNSNPNPNNNINLSPEETGGVINDVNLKNNMNLSKQVKTYNLVGGVNMPNSDIDIPNVLIDYKS